ncbi:ABC transporter ATP-binding protein [Methylobacterium gnaphalii]|uniref:Polyamine-transporting ATPase n=1 Tax=Methylobacterium gnaphalii TaxID=1010610 RepID=A0A512JI67_9HYPH|nr:ABC transporter ATP-binding protein [Methylobacterium gnaphalii]GEP09649.1 polyamine-transporting ATPase [Methylobacterium gnaphalii]GJD67763.1 Spermidine/putrescine import ATP-binding protein PotA [Methylobacterium gnaphalii]GLS50068.1 polyamine-transporting ATPase [Methylobacterium gnaphalii]
MQFPSLTPTDPLLRIDRVTKRFGAHRAVDDVSLDLAAGEFLCLLGPSGCGKSTLLRLIAGFETPDAGAIMLGGEDLARQPPHRRPVNMMFQSYALFPHMSVAQNLAYGLQGLGLSRVEITERVQRLLRLVKLEGFEARRPDKLSGGQRQRVALARALAREPRLLLLDEPLGALDRALREETQGELRAIQRRLGTSFVVVTHDPEEAMALADRIVVMDRGRILQAGPARDLYEHPATRFVAGLLGDVNLIAGTLGLEDGATRGVHTAFGCLRALPSLALADAAAGTAVVIALRPERLQLGTGDNTLSGTLVDAAYLGDRVRRQIRMTDGTMLRASASLPGNPGDAGIGQSISLGFAPDAAWILPA